MDKNNVRGPSKTSKARRKIRLAVDTMKRIERWRTQQDEQKKKLDGYWSDDTAVPTTSAGKLLDRRQFNDGCKAVCVEVGIGLISAYDLRTTAMSYQAKRGHTVWGRSPTGLEQAKRECQTPTAKNSMTSLGWVRSRSLASSVVKRNCPQVDTIRMGAGSFDGRCVQTARSQGLTMRVGTSEHEIAFL